MVRVGLACRATSPEPIDRQGRTAPGERLTEAINTATDAYMRLHAGTHAYAREADQKIQLFPGPHSVADRRRSVGPAVIALAFPANRTPWEAVQYFTCTCILSEQKDGI